VDFKVDRRYSFLRGVGGRSEQASFACFEDGSAVVEIDGDITIWEEAEDAREMALADLRSRGFLVVHEETGLGPGLPGGQRT
jgi:hypothetical protein